MGRPVPNGRSGSGVGLALTIRRQTAHAECLARSPTLEGSRPRVPEVADPAGLQVVRRQDRARVRAGRHGRRRPQRLREVEPRRRGGVGARRPGPPALGAKMDDVIFAGTPDRPALGRAEVSLTIDNTAGLLPIEFSEVTITRTLFRAATPSTRSTARRAACSTSRSCCPTPASVASSTSSSARASSTPCSTPAPKTAARSSRRRPGS